MSPFPLLSRGAYVSFLLSDVEQEQKPSGNGEREAIVVGVVSSTLRASVYTLFMTPHYALDVLLYVQ